MAASGDAIPGTKKKFLTLNHIFLFGCMHMTVCDARAEITIELS